MDCEKFLTLLDAYVDNELSEAEKEQFLMHAETCENCKMELRNAEALRSLLADLDDGVAVPLEAQAVWRRAVREEQKKKSARGAKRMWTRVSYAAAAVLLLAGCTLAFGGDLIKRPAATLEMGTVQNDGAVTEAAADFALAGDGARSVSNDLAAQKAESYTAWKKISAADYSEACETIAALTGEYNGISTVEEMEGESVYRIELPYAYMEDFLNAVSRIGTELDSRIVEEASETAIVCIQICKAE